MQKIKPIEILLTFARRYCMERVTQLRIERTAARAEPASNEVDTIHPRRQVVEAIQTAVERLRPEDLRSRQHAEHRLVETAQTAQGWMMAQKMWQKSPYIEAMQEERDRFAEAIRSFASQKDWKQWNVEPLPYRRTLSEDEHNDLMERLRERWGITKRWWVPFDNCELSYPVMIMDSKAVQSELTIHTLRQIFAKHGVKRLYEVWDVKLEPSRELDSTIWEPYQRNWPECYWMTEQMDWLFFTTHENSTTIAGDWLLAEIKAVWPNWEAHQWVAPWAKKERNEDAAP